MSWLVRRSSEIIGRMSQKKKAPLLLSIGLVLTIVKCALTMLVTGIGMMIFMGVFAAGSVPVLDKGQMDAILGLTIVGFSGTTLFAALIFFQAVKIFVCLKAWGLGRFWLIVVIALTLFGVFSEGPTTYRCCLYAPIIVDLMILIGASIALSREN